MPVQHSPPAKNTRSQRSPAVLTPTESVPLDCTPSFYQLSANLDRGPPPYRRGGMKSRRSRSFSGLLGGYPGMYEGARERLGEAKNEEGKYEETEVETALKGAPEASEAEILAPTNQPLVSQSDPSLLKIMKQMATIMGQLSQAAALRENSKDPSFRTTSMKAPDPFDSTQAH
ncbi:hypothetical protein O181_100396 [Austropuccinia psidii MF-1]|uniref:Uncharacterized protein n=1 Tax=Austropuccinia psidii MF-1 TaxID=1389203 RepID=A0A9Q3JEQ5_9BASI|nr:hypothetical protein [Austropuccinia psidii MF-1]